MTQNSVSVAPSSAGAERDNPIVLPPGGTFELRLDLPEGAHDVRESWELRSVDERYAQRLTRADAVLDPQTAQMKLVFAGLYTDGSYTLIHHGAAEAQITVFAEVSFGELTEHGSETSAPEAAEAEEIEDEDDVQAESEHPEVQHDPTLDVLEIEDDDSDSDADRELPTILAPPDEPEAADDDEASGLTNATTGPPETAPSTPPPGTAGGSSH